MNCAVIQVSLVLQVAPAKKSLAEQRIIVTHPHILILMLLLFIPIVLLLLAKHALLFFGDALPHPPTIKDADSANLQPLMEVRKAECRPTLLEQAYTAVWWWKRSYSRGVELSQDG